jgi:hypothetical protein
MFQLLSQASTTEGEIFEFGDTAVTQGAVQVTRALKI